MRGIRIAIAPHLAGPHSPEIHWAWWVLLTGIGWAWEEVALDQTCGVAYSVDPARVPDAHLSARANPQGWARPPSYRLGGIERCHGASLLRLGDEGQVDDLIEVSDERMVCHRDVAFDVLWLASGQEEQHWRQDRHGFFHLTGTVALREQLTHLGTASEIGPWRERKPPKLGFPPRLPPGPDGKHAAASARHDVDYPEVVRWLEPLRILARHGARGLGPALDVPLSRRHHWHFGDWEDMEKRVQTRSAFYFVPRQALLLEEVALGDHSVVRPLTLICLSGRVELGAYAEISSLTLVYGASSLIVGAHSYVGPQSLINADEVVRLGRGSALGPRSMVFTHGSFLPYTEGYPARLAGVTLGDRVWCAGGVFLHPGVEIGDDTFVNSRSVVTGIIPGGSVVESNPARVVCPIDRTKHKMTPRRLDAALEQVLASFGETGLRRELGIENATASEGQLRFRWRRRRYRVAVVSSAGDWPGAAGQVPRERQILLLNRPDWSPPPGALVSDLITMETHSSSDRIHTALRRFLQRYYGLRFTNADHHTARILAHREEPE